MSILPSPYPEAGSIRAEDSKSVLYQQVISHGMMRKLKPAILGLLYYSGILAFYHNIRNRRTLTVVMFHRVLAEADSRWTAADPEWTVSVPFFNAMLRFFKKHYHVISLDELDSYCRHNGRLPPRSLLITFDDGWSDNYQYALPILQQQQLPATVFVVADSVGQRRSFWQDTLWGAWRRKQLTAAIAVELWKKSGLPVARCPLNWDDEASVRGFIDELNRSADEHIARIREDIFQLGDNPADQALMLSADELLNLCKAGISIGSHGQTHVPLTRVSDPAAELKVSREKLTGLLAGCQNQIVKALSFPHSRANAAIVQQARQYGYEYQFTGGDGINYQDRNQRILARFNIHQGKLSNQAGILVPAKAAMHMFRKPRKVLAH